MSIDIDSPEATAHVPVAPAAPRTRWAAVIWGAVFATIAASMIVLVGDGDDGDTVGDWVMSLTPASITATVLLALGAIVLICGAIGLIRRAQRRAASV